MLSHRYTAVLLSRIRMSRIVSYSSSRNHPLAVPPVPHHKYFSLIDNLRNTEYVSQLLKEQERLLHLHQDKIMVLHLQQTTSKVNNLLMNRRLITWAKAYHPNLQVTDYSQQLVEQIIEEYFQHQVQSNPEEDLQSNQALHFYLYFELAEKIAPSVAEIYLHSYLYLARERWPLELLKVNEAIQEQEPSQHHSLIVKRSRILLSQMVKSIWDKCLPKTGLSDGQMALYLGHYKSRLEEMNEEQREQVKGVIFKYVKNNAPQNSFLYLQNMTYCLYLGFNRLAMKREITEWLSSMYQSEMLDDTAVFMSTLYSHEDKLTCLKVDFWMAVLEHIQTIVSFEKESKLCSVAEMVLVQLAGVKFGTWRYNYSVWMFDSLVCSHEPQLKLILSLQKAICSHSMASHRLLASFLSPFMAFTLDKSLTADILRMETEVSQWMSAQTDQNLSSQPSSVLCEVLPHADRHPALQTLYLPYLERLLNFSLGRFEWPLLTQLYYFGLRWKANTGESGFWRMEYVRRYIMNEYASMGIRRRDIPEHSFFYRIHEETTPEQFYKDYLNN